MFDPTPEQDEALDLARAGDSFVIRALAGAGKTSTLRLIADDLAERTIRYVAFNRAVVNDAIGSFPRNVGCDTGHGLAREVGKRYRHRWGGSRPRLRGDQLARLIGVRDPISVEVGPKRKLLAAGFLAGQARKTVDRFATSADDEIGPHHMPTIVGIDLPRAGEHGISYRGPNNRAVAEVVARYARTYWSDVLDPAGSVPFDQQYYIKVWQMERTPVAADVILFDEAQDTNDCQPRGTLVDLPGGRQVPIETINAGDRVASYSMKALALNDRHGSLVESVAARPYDGPLVTVTTATGKQSDYSPEHRCVAKMGPALDGRHVLYLMRQGDRYRVGVTSGRYRAGRGGSVGLVGRLREERGDAVWILAAFDSRPEALAAEQAASLIYRLPQCRFSDPFWSKWDTALSDPSGCAAHYGRLLAHPLVDARRFRLFQRAVEVRACNLLDGMLVIDADAFRATGTRGRSTGWTPISVGRRHYTGPLYSMNVAGSHTYVGDRIVTHNCMLAAIASQDAQIVWVGDPYQQIYEWNGAVNALGKVGDLPLATLSQSFRFGPAIADVANHVLHRWLDAPVSVRGYEAVASTVGPIEPLTEPLANPVDGSPQVILCRTNAGAVAELFSALGRGLHPAIVGGADQVIRFARAAIDLTETGRCSHPDLLMFGSWGEVQDYVTNDPTGSDLAMLVKLVDDFTPERIVAELENTCDERIADVIVSTAHKAKGREWDEVVIGSDFPDPDVREPADEESRLLYVAVTRAKLRLDARAAPMLTGYQPAPTAAF